MANLEERVTVVEAQTDKHAVAVEALRKDFLSVRDELRDDMAVLRTDMRGEMAALRTEMRGEMGVLRGEMTELRTDFREMSRRTDRLFLWLAGTQVATLLAVIGPLAGILYKTSGS